MKKRLLSTLLALCMVLTLLPSAALAEQTDMESASSYQERVEIQYTEEELALLQRMRTLYADSTSAWNRAAMTEDYYIEDVQYKDLPLKAGRVNPVAIKAAIQFLNVIRIGAGLSELSYSEELSEGAQHKAVLSCYFLYNGISNPSPHYPPQPKGVSDAFYAKAQMGGGENLYMGDVLTSIINALDDGYGDPITCGHRYNLLNPTYVNIGLGSSGSQGVHKFSGYQASNVDVVAWPSKGIMISEAGAGSGQMYTIKFYNYAPTKDSGVIFKCLNTGETFTFDSNMKNTDTRQFHRSGYILSYYDESIAMEAGNVYEITATNVKNTKTGKVTDYTYRCVYESMFAEETEPATYTVTVNASPSAGGTVTGGGNYDEGASVTVNAVANNGYKFVEWQEKGVAVSASASYTFTISTDRTLTAIFEPISTGGTSSGDSSSGSPPEDSDTHTSTTTPTPESTGSTTSVAFPDVNESDWYYTHVTDLATAGIISGFDDGTFRPDEAITGGQVLKLIMMAAGYPNLSVSSAEWARPFMEQALKDGLLSDEIGLDKRISRYDIAEIAAKALKLPMPKGTKSPFADMDMSHSSAPYVLALYEAGIVNGSEVNGELRYLGTYAITRSEMSAIIWRMYNYNNYGIAEP